VTEAQKYPKRLIEVDLPIRKISEHARREKSIRQGHISTLHLWWARRPLAACRAAALGALLPDPADPLCGNELLDEITTLLNTLRQLVGGKAIPPRDGLATRQALLEFIATFSNWDLTNDERCLGVARQLVEAASRTRGSGRPLVLDPFAGGGAIPVEVLRIGADVFASDLNPIPILLNTVALEYAPRYGVRLADEVRRCAAEILRAAKNELASAFASFAREQSIAYLWARTIRCEGPGCGAEVPMLRSRWVAKRGTDSVALLLRGDRKNHTVEVDIATGAATRGIESSGTVARGSVLCPVCGFTTKVDRVRQQLKSRAGGARDARLLAVVYTRPGHQGRFYRTPIAEDLAAVELARRRFEQLPPFGNLSAVPDERISTNELRRISVPLYGMETWGDIFTSRQALALATFVKLVRDIKIEGDDGFVRAVRTCLAFAVDRVADANSSLATWSSSGEFVRFTFARQAVPMVWDFVECNPLADASGSWLGATEWVADVLSTVFRVAPPGTVHVGHASAAAHPLPDDSVDAVVTDPPYYDAVPYAHLSDFFYVWLRRSVGQLYPDLFASDSVDKTREIVVDRKHKLSTSKKDIAFYERELCKAFGEARRVVKPDGIAVVVFASKSTASWEAVLGALLEAGWVVTASWPIASERAARMAARGQARLESSIHIACRPREFLDGLLRDERGDWRLVLDELPRRIQAWMPRLAAEGIVGADAIFACLGPALEIFSRYSSVEKASGERVTLREYLEHVWSTVAREALSMVFDGADMAGLEPDARLTAMWLWTVAAPGDGAAQAAEGSADDDAESSDDEEADDKAESDDQSAATGFALEFDAARKIAQGLGVRLEEHNHLVEVKGDKARLLAVTERTKHLFGKSEDVPTAKKVAKKKQMTLFGELEAAAEVQGWGEVGAPKAGTTTLDRVHQAMLLFGSGRGEALKRFLVEEGVGKQAQFWKLAQSLSALYPSGSDEKRWVDGVLARKKGLGFG
jgi:adenine-specific DNA methylase